MIGRSSAVCFLRTGKLGLGFGLSWRKVFFEDHSVVVCFFRERRVEWVHMLRVLQHLIRDLKYRRKISSGTRFEVPQSKSVVH